MDLNKIFESMPGAIIVLSPEYKILATTDAYLRIVMREREQILGLHFLLEAFPDRELSFEENPVRESIEKAIETKKVAFLDVIRYDLLNPSGEYDIRYWEATHTPVLDDAGQVIYIIQHTSDVTEREQAKNALKETESKLNFMAEAMPQLIFTTDDKGNLTYLNKRWETYTGITIRELMEDGWQQVIHPEDLEKSKEKWEAAFMSGSEMQLELRKRDKEGVYRWHICRSLPMKDEQGNITMWVGSSTDIHDTHKLVHELLETNEEMARLSDQMQLAFEKAESRRNMLENLMMEAPAMFVILKGPEHRFELLNEKYQQLYPGRNLIGLALGEALPEIKAQGFIEVLDNVYQTGETFTAEGVPIFLPKDGVGELEEHFFNFSYQPVVEADKITGILAFGYDITNEVLFRRKMEKIG